MSDPRSATTNRVGVEPSMRTYKIDGTDIVYDGTLPGGSAVIGRAVMESGAGIVRLTADGSDVVGKLVKVEDDGYCSVLRGGVTTLPSSGTIAVGNKVVGALLSAARGYIRGVVAATLADVAAGRHQVIDVTDVNNVEVELNA